MASGNLSSIGDFDLLAGLKDWGSQLNLFDTTTTKDGIDTTKQGVLGPAMQAFNAWNSWNQGKDLLDMKRDAMAFEEGKFNKNYNMQMDQYARAANSRSAEQAMAKRAAELGRWLTPEEKANISGQYNTGANFLNNQGQIIANPTNTGNATSVPTENTANPSALRSAFASPNNASQSMANLQKNPSNTSVNNDTKKNIPIARY